MKSLFGIQILLGAIVLITCSPVIDFQFLLDPKEAQATLTKLDKVSEAVERKRLEWAQNLREIDAERTSENPELRKLHESIQNLKNPAEYKDILEKYGKLRANKDKGGQLREKIQLAGSFLESMEGLKGLLRPNSGYIQFSQVRSLIRALRGASFELFSPAEAATDFGEICIEMLTIRKPSVDLKKDYKELCF